MTAHIMKILLVEDDKLLNHHLSSLLTEADNQVYSTDQAGIALHYAADYPIDVAIIDLGLPDMDGLQLIRQLRERQIPFPIIVLTARGNWQDKVEGLEAGADDYLVKPFQKDELLARLNALVRRSAGFISPKVKAGDYELDLSRKELTISGEVAVLTSFEYLILEYLMRNARQVVSKQQLLDQLYGDGEGDPNTIEVMVSRLRKKLDPEGTIQPISTIRVRVISSTSPVTDAVSSAAPHQDDPQLTAHQTAAQLAAGHRADHGVCRLRPLSWPRRRADPEGQRPDAGEPGQAVLLHRAG